MSRKFSLFFLFIALVVGGVALASFSFAQNYGLDATAGEAGLKGNTIDTVPALIGRVIGAGLSMISVLFFLLMLYGGILWMTARGDSDQTKKALNTIIAAAIGIVIVLASYALTNFVFESVKETAPMSSSTPPV